MICLSSYPPELLRLGRWEALLELRLRPVVWRIILKEYEGSLVIYQAGAGKQAGKPPPEPIKAEAVGGGLHPPLAHNEGEGEGEHMGYQPPAVVGNRPSPALPGHTASPRRDPVVESPTLASLLHEYSTGG